MRRGFSLLEITLVLVIIFILAGLGASVMFRQVERARWVEAKAILGILRSAQIRYSIFYKTSFCEDLTYPFECLDINLTLPNNNFVYQIHNNPRGLAWAFRRTGTYSGEWMHITYDGDFIYSNIPDWLRD
ncbi:MAG: type II secretion system GspH family protein [Candidatus Omnitrophica bacterium]|nr:type II secretion system GspH family protein [Candidatus Omnitrophota bacterium]